MTKEEKRRDEVLAKMLATPPQPHKKINLKVAAKGRKKS